MFSKTSIAPLLPARGFRVDLFVQILYKNGVELINLKRHFS